MDIKTIKNSSENVELEAVKANGGAIEFIKKTEPYQKAILLKCSCGAKYTSNPSHHYDWCGKYRPDND